MMPAGQLADVRQRRPPSTGIRGGAPAAGLPVGPFALSPRNTSTGSARWPSDPAV